MPTPEITIVMTARVSEAKQSGVASAGCRKERHNYRWWRKRQTFAMHSNAKSTLGKTRVFAWVQYLQTFREKTSGPAALNVRFRNWNVIGEHFSSAARYAFALQWIRNTWQVQRKTVPCNYRLLMFRFNWRASKAVRLESVFISRRDRKGGQLQHAFFAYYCTSSYFYTRKRADEREGKQNDRKLHLQVQWMALSGSPVRAFIV